jgi:DNA-binding MarR family transcriptional regulator
MADVKITERPLSENAKVVLAYLKANDNGEVGYFGNEIAEACGMSPVGIQGTLNSLVKRELVGKGSREKEFSNKAGSGVKPYTTYFITDAGRAYEA